MIVLNNGDKIRGDASAATVVDYTIHGVVTATLTQLADGQLASSIGDLYTAGAIVVVTTIILVNTDSSARTINLYLTPSGGTARRILAKDVSLGIGYSLHWDGAKVTILDTNGAIVTATTVDIVNDTTPQLGGDLDLNSKNIDFPTTANISDCLDEDNMISNSATVLATQQSIKAYADTKLANTVEDTSPELGGELDSGAHSIGFTQQTTTGDGTTTIDWRIGNKFYFTYGAQNDTFTFTAPSNPCTLTLVLKQDGTGSRTPTWPATVKWPTAGTEPTWSSGANEVDIVAFYYDGTNYFGIGSLDFST